MSITVHYLPICCRIKKNMKMKKTMLFLVMTLMGLSAFAQNSKDISMFPEAPEGFKKVVIHLTEKKKENLLKVEFTVGKNVTVDKCNTFFLMGEIKEKDLTNWGYSYYNFTSDGNVAGTKMGCNDDTKVEKFITGQSKTIDYNSKSPIVIYIPNEMQVKYRVWKAKNKWLDVK